MTYRITIAHRPVLPGHWFPPFSHVVKTPRKLMLPTVLLHYPTGRRDLRESATARMTGEIRRRRQKLHTLKELRQTKSGFSCAE